MSDPVQILQICDGKEEEEEHKTYFYFLDDLGTLENVLKGLVLSLDHF